jgi:ribosomal protein S18 acetylase RimI-like enzyme
MITTRKAISSDIPALTALLKELFAVEQDFSFDEIRQGRGLRQMIDNQRGCLLVAAVDGRVVGMCSGQLTISTAEGGLALLIEDVVVAKQWRRIGIGKCLMNAIAEWARLMKVTRLQLLADRNNEQALNFYKNIGWQSTQLICLRKTLN